MSCNGETESEVIHPVMNANLFSIVIPCEVTKLVGDISYTQPEVGGVDVALGDSVKVNLFYNIPAESGLHMKCSDGDVLEFNSAPEHRTVMFDTHESNI